MDKSLTTAGPRAVNIITSPSQALALIDGFQPLVKFEDQDLANRPDNLACVSAGYKNSEGIPVVSRDGTLYVADPEKRAPGLAEILKANGNRKLTIALPSNDPAECISMSFRLESKTRLEAFGDYRGITTIAENGARVFHAAGTKQFDQLRARCKVVSNITFILADYDENGRPIYPFPDGFGTYRIRTASPNTVANLLATLKKIAGFSGGQVAGVPLETSLAYRNVAGPDGTKRNVPVFVFTLKPPKSITLSSRTFGVIAEGARDEITMHMPALPAPEDIEAAIATYELTPDDADALQSGVNPDIERKRWFRMVEGTILDSDQARHGFLYRYTQSATHSLKTFLERARNQEQVEHMFAAAERFIEEGKHTDAGTGEVIEAQLVNDPPAWSPSGEDLTRLYAAARQAGITKKVDLRTWLAKQGESWPDHEEHLTRDQYDQAVILLDQRKQVA